MRLNFGAHRSNRSVGPIIGQLLVCLLSVEPINNSLASLFIDYWNFIFGRSCRRDLPHPLDFLRSPNSVLFIQIFNKAIQVKQNCGKLF